MVQRQEIDKLRMAAHNRKMGNICHAYVHRRGNRDQAVYANMLFYACLTGVILNRRCINVDITIITVIGIFNDIINS